MFFKKCMKPLIFSEHIEHIRSIAGINAVGIGADYDGVDE